MKAIKRSLLLLLCMLPLFLYSQKVIVVSCPDIDLGSLLFTNLKEKYQIKIEGDIEDTLLLIEQLLTLENDIRINCIPIMGYCSTCSTLYTGDNELYSIQVSALFHISYLINKGFQNSPYPVLINRETRKEETIYGEGIRTAFKLYKEWLLYAKEKGLNVARANSPLANSCINWYQ